MEAAVAHKIRRLRTALGLDQEELGRRIERSAAVVSKIENGSSIPDAALLDRIAHAFDCSSAFLRHDAGLSASTKPCLRAYADASKRATDRQVADAETALEFVRMAQLPVFPELLPEFGGDVHSEEEIEDIALETRLAASVSASEPVGNVIRAAERLGCVVLPMQEELGRRHIGLSFRTDCVPVIAVTKHGTNDGRPLSGDRQRFTVAHELGHLVMHSHMPEPRTSIEASEREHEAHRFAGAFLMPADALYDEFVDLGHRATLSAFRMLKARWGISIRALVMRFKDLGIIDPDQARSFHKQISARGWTKVEPVDVPTESALWMLKAIERSAGQDHAQAAIQHVAGSTGLGARHIQRWTDWTTTEAMLIDGTSRFEAAASALEAQPVRSRRIVKPTRESAGGRNRGHVEAVAPPAYGDAGRARSHLAAISKEHTMSKDGDRHVVPNSDGGWDVTKPGAGRASSHQDTQAAAIDRAREIVGNAGGGEVVIHGRDGQIRDSDTVAPGNDPNPPKDRK